MEAEVGRLSSASLSLLKIKIYVVHLNRSSSPACPAPDSATACTGERQSMGSSKDEEISLDNGAGLPPPYSPPPDASASHEHEHGHKADSSRTFDSIQNHIAASRHSYELREDNGSVIISRGTSSNGQFRIDFSGTTDDSDIITYKLDGRASHVVARAKLTQRRGDFEIYVGHHTTPKESDWATVQCVAGGLLKPDSYRFRARSRPLLWKRSHDFAVGSHKFDYKLEDESNVGKRASIHRSPAASMQPSGPPGSTGGKVITGGDEIAHYLQHATESVANLQGRVEWSDEFGEEVEISALMTLVVVLERTRKHK